jgi:hypothetical protein
MENEMERTPRVQGVGDDQEGDLYDHVKANLPPRRPVQGVLAPLDAAGNAFRDWQDGPDIPRPTTAQSFIPVIGPAWEAVGDLQDGKYGSAAFNGAMAVADALPIGVAGKGVRAASKGIGVFKKGSVTAGAAAKQIRAKGLAGAGEEIHHTIPLKGLSRSAQDPRNHYALLKTLPIEQHRRLTGSWLRDGVRMPKYGPVGQIWYGTTDWMKAVPAGVAGYAADSVENISRSKSPPPKPLQTKPPS